MRRGALILAMALLTACSGTRFGGETLSELRPQPVASTPAQPLQVSAPETIASYRQLVALPEDNPFRPRAMHRLADLLLDYGERGEATASAPEAPDSYGEAIELYRELLARYPDYPARDEVLYQLGRAYANQGDLDRTQGVLQRLVAEYPDSRHRGEAHFRLAEWAFLDGEYGQAQRHYGAVLALGEGGLHYQAALLKRGWTQFKQGQLGAALQSFFSLLDLKLETVNFDDISGEPRGLRKADAEIMADTFRGITLIFARQKGIQVLDDYRALFAQRPYAHLVYQRLAERYHKEERYADEARVYAGFIEAYPDSAFAPLFQIRRVDAHRLAHDPEQVVAAQEQFVTRFWRPDTDRPDTPPYEAHLTRFAREYLDELSEFYHARYQKRRAAGDYDAAVRWYGRYLAEFHGADDAVEKHFLMAELLYQQGEQGGQGEQGAYAAAGQAYEQVAYFYPPHGRAAEAGYSAILAYGKQLRTAGHDSDTWRAAQRRSALRFVSTFPQDPRLPNTLLSLANDDFERGDRDNARVLILMLLTEHDDLAAPDAYAAWMLLGHIAHGGGDHVQAERAFATARRQVAANSPQALEAEQWQALSVYRQAEVLLDREETQAGLALLLTIPELAPSSELAAQARYDAAAQLIGLQQWSRAAALLETVRDRYPRHPLQAELPVKLAFVYMKLGRTAEAARAYGQIAASTQDPELQQEALWQAAQLYYQSRDLTQAALAYKRYLQRFPGPDAQAFRAREQLADIYAQQTQFSSRDYWLREIINHAQQAGVQDRAIQQLAARAAFTLAEDAFAEFKAVALVEPLRQTLSRKKQKMEAALASYARVADYDQAEFISAATHRSGEVYMLLSQALLASQRPPNLDEEELEQYELMLEEQAYPFEERAIDLLQSNAARVEDGVYNRWVKQSLAALATLLPLQYAKQEQRKEVIHALH